MLFSGPIIGKCFDLYGQYSESELDMMRLFLTPGDTALDVGANIGDLTIPLSRSVGTSGRVYAFESNPELFNVLCANLALNEITNTKPINAFVAATDDVTTAGVWGEFAYTGTKWKPSILPIDSLELDRCDLIKVDVDGKELEVLRSAEMHIERYRPILYFENDIRDQSSALLEFVMRTLGYNTYWHPAPVFDANNFFGNPANHWAPYEVISLMVLAVPTERRISVPPLRPIKDQSEWWEHVHVWTQPQRFTDGSQV